MLCQMSRRAYIDALLHSDDAIKELSDILEPVVISVDDPPVPLKSTEVAEILERAPSLLDIEYNGLLHYLHQTGRPYQAYSDVPHPSNSIILPPQAQHLMEIH